MKLQAKIYKLKTQDNYALCILLCKTFQMTWAHDYLSCTMSYHLTYYSV